MANPIQRPAVETASAIGAGGAWLGAHLGMISTVIAIAAGTAYLISMIYSVRLKRREWKRGSQ